MGVPNFFTWFVNRYPLVYYDFTYDNGHRTDFFYMDMNQPGVLFRDQIAEKRFAELWVSVFNYIDNIVNLVKPEKVLFLTLDGVAPRAKMNQQRQRRFQSAKRSQRIDLVLQSIGEIERNQTFKNNQISPGTEFMHELNQQIKFFIQTKIKEDPRWRNLKVIFSGADVPGEGEHKILEFIRNIQKSPNFDINSTHMIYGADADLIMLGLLTQIRYISLVREIIEKQETVSSATQRNQVSVNFQLINLTIAREYLDLEYKEIAPFMKVQYDINRIIDDFIMICFFIGNDFLPRVYCFDIIQGTLESLIILFKSHLKECDNYLTNRGQLNLKEFAKLVDRLQQFEILALSNREEELNEFMQKHQDPTEEISIMIQKEVEIIDGMKRAYANEAFEDARVLFYRSKFEIDLETEDDKQFADATEQIQKFIAKYVEGFQFVLLYYYEGVPSWIWYYPTYYAPLCSDISFYLEHLLTQQSQNQCFFSLKAEKGQPYPPFKQLLSILSPINALLLPEQFRYLLTSQNSKLRYPIDYYPSEFQIDPYGAIWEHQHIIKIPFVEEKLIDEVYNSVDQSKIEPNIIARNQCGLSYLFQYNKNTQSINIVSKIKEVFQDFSFNIGIETFNIENKQSCQDIVNNLQPCKVEQFRLPSLKINIQNHKLQEYVDQRRKGKRIFIIQQNNTHQWLQILMESRKNKKRVFAYVGYPAPYYSEVIGIITEKSILFGYNYKHYDSKELKKYDYNPSKHQVMFFDLRQVFLEKLYKKGIDSQNVQALAIVRQYKRILRDAKQGFYLDQMKEQFVICDWLFQKPPVDLDDLGLNLDWNKEINQRGVIITHKDKKLIGSVVQFNCNDINKTQIIKGKIIKQLGQTDQKKLKLLGESSYFSIQNIAEIHLTTVPVLLYIFGSVVIHLNEDLPSYFDLVPNIEIGMNIINRQKNLLVPELVRIDQGDSQAQGQSKYQNYRALELSSKCVEYLKEYVSRAKYLLWHLERMQNRDSDLQKIPKIFATDIFPRSKDANIDLIQFYVWLSQSKISHFTLSSVAASVIQSSKIHEIEKLSQKEIEIIPQECEINLKHYNIQFEPIKFYIPPYFQSHPPIHEPGDRIVCLNSIKQGLPSFGTYGYVVGVLDSGDELLVEVIWDQTQVGLRDLGQRCSLMRGSVCEFCDIFNISKEWNKYLRPIGEEPGWDYMVKIYQPKFKDVHKIETYDKQQQEKLIDEKNEFYQQIENQEQQNKQSKKLNIIQRKVTDSPIVQKNMLNQIFTDALFQGYNVEELEIEALSLEKIEEEILKSNKEQRKSREEKQKIIPKEDPEEEKNQVLPVVLAQINQIALQLSQNSPQINTDQLQQQNQPPRKKVLQKKKTDQTSE